MTKRNLRIFFLISISITGIFIGYKKAASCTISFEGDDRYVNVFDKSLFNLPDLKPFFLSSHAFADRDERDIEKSAFHNLNKWAEYVKNNATLDDIEAVVYAASLDTLKLIHKAVADNSKDMLTEGYKNNSFVKYLFENKKKEAAEYLVFAKRCEPQVSYYDTWSEHSPDSALKISLFKEGQKYCREYHSRFIKDRYAYQTIRLAHYTQQYETAVNLYNKYFGSSVSTDLISNWALAHKAGALMSLGKIPEANLLFAKVFDKCESRRKQAVLSLKLKDEEIINKTLKLCRAPQEKILVYTLSTYNNNIKAVNFLEKVYKIDSRSKYLELLLQRVVTEYERQTIPLREDMYFKNYLSLNRNIVNDIDSGNIIDKNKAYDLICKIAVSKKVHNPYLWNFAAGYMAALQNKYEEAMKFYYEAKRDCPKNDYSYIKRIQAAETIAKINNQGKIDKKFEAAILPDLKLIDNLRSTEKSFGDNAYIYIMNLLAQKYIAQGDTVKAHLCIGSKNEIGYLDPFSYNILTEYNKYPVDKIYSFITDAGGKENVSEFDRYLISKYNYYSEEIEMIQVRQFISKGNFTEALAKINKNEYREPVYLKADPFSIQIKDDHERDYKYRNKDVYTLKSFCERMIELSGLAEKDKANAAKYYFLIGNGLYNKTYYGSSWFASAFYRGVYSYGFKDFFDCTQAQIYYLKAFNASQDKEFKTKCLFMASKCEQNTYLYNKYYSKDINYDYYEEEQLRVPAEYRIYFKQLKNEYADTQYYNEILKECKYFNNFVHN